MPKKLILTAFLFSLPLAYGQSLAEKNRNQILSNMKYIDSVSNEVRKSRMNLKALRIKVREKSGRPGCNQKTRVYYRGSDIYVKSVYNVDKEQKIKVLSLNGKVIMVKFNYRWRSAEKKPGPYITRHKVRFMRVGDRWLYTNIGKVKLMDEKEKLTTRRVRVKEYVTTGF